MVDEVVHGIEEAGARAVRFLVADHAVGGCIACEGCYSTGVCVIRDDMDVFLESMDGCDALVVVTPVYFSGVPSQLKAVYDRLECRWAARYLLGAPRPKGPSRPSAGAWHRCRSLRVRSGGLGVRERSCDAGIQTARHTRLRRLRHR